MDEKTEQLVRELAEKFGTTAEHLWEILVRQATVQSVASLITVLFCGVILITWTVIWCKKQSKWFPVDEDNDFEENIPFVLISIATVMVWLVFVTAGGDALYEAVCALLNPEYWALKQLLPK